MTSLKLELSEYYEEGQWPMIRHPLVYAVPFFDTHEEAQRLNKMLEQKQEALERAEVDHKWNSYVFLHERPHRLNAFKQIHENLVDADYWPLLGQIWIDSENIRDNAIDWWEMLTSPRAKRKLFMQSNDRCVFRKLPLQIEVYRGTKSIEISGHYTGFSYSLNRTQAEWFANRFVCEEDGKPVIMVAQLERDACVGYLNGRGEEEIVATDCAMMEARWEYLE